MCVLAALEVVVFQLHGSFIKTGFIQCLRPRGVCTINFTKFSTPPHFQEKYHFLYLFFFHTHWVFFCFFANYFISKSFSPKQKVASGRATFP